MTRGSRNGRGHPEGLVYELQHRLWRHRLLDWTLMALPILLAVVYVMGSLYTAGWITTEVTVFLLAATLGCLFALALVVGTKKLPLITVARFIDQRVKGQDRFVTLATIDSGLFSAALIQRLRGEAVRLLHRFDLRRDFPYRFRRSFFASMLVSLALIGISQVWMNLSSNRNSAATSLDELKRVAQKLSSDPLAAELGHQLMELKNRIEEHGLKGAGNEQLVRDLRRQLRYQLAAGGGGEGGQGELLEQAARTLQNLAGHQRSDSGLGNGLEPPGGRDSTEKGDTGSGSGASGTTQAPAGGQKEELNASSMQLSEQRPGNRQQEKSQQNGMDQPPGMAGAERGRGRGSSLEPDKRGTENENDRDPNGQTPDRFHQSGEGKEERLEGARYVIVELPEGEEGPGATVPMQGRVKRQGSKFPVRNVPLPAVSRRDAPVEKQQIPLEYRGILR